MIHLTKIKPVVPLTKIEHEPQPVTNPYPWEVDEDNFPIKGKTSEKLRFLLNYARSASLDNNNQLRSFTIVDDFIELRVEKTSTSPVADVDRRELIISCGAALFNLRIAIRHFGYRDLVEIFPKPDKSNLLARIGLGSRRIVSLEENFLFRAIFKRCSKQAYFANRHLPKSLISELELATDAECTMQVSAHVIPNNCRHQVTELIDRGDRLQITDPLYYRELVGIDTSHDAISTAITTTLMLIGSQDDDNYAWLATGEALAHLLLRARIDDVGVSFLNQPIQIPKLRSRLQAMFPENGHPQILLCLGYIENS